MRASGHAGVSPLAALAWCGQHAPDLVIVDYLMPEMDGISFIQAFRALPGCAEIPVLMVTASDERAVRYEALSHGASDFLTKPIDRMEFLARARNMLALRSSQKALAERAESLAEAVSRAVAQVAERERDTIFRLARAAEYRDPETGAHVLRMAHYSRLIGAALGLPEAEQEMLFQAAPMHDIGKVGTPDHILLKPGLLDASELDVMRQHASIGYEILRDGASPILQMAAVIANSHHEKYDGTGYPAGLIGEAIPLLGRIVAVADVFDALTSARPYKRAWSLDEARAYLEANAGLHFDPRCVAAFCQHWERVLEIRQRYQDPAPSALGTRERPAGEEKP